MFEFGIIIFTISALMLLRPLENSNDTPRDQYMLCVGC